MNRRKVLKDRNCGIKKTSTPLNQGREFERLPSLKNISTVKKSSKAKETAVFETPLLTIGVGGNGSNKLTNKYSSVSKQSKRLKSRERCATPFRSKRSSLFSEKLAACPQKLTFSHISDVFCGSKISECKKHPGPSDKKFNVNESEKIFSKLGRSKCGDSVGKFIRKENSPSSIKNQNAADEELNDKNPSNDVDELSHQLPGKCNISSISTIPKKKNLSESEVIINQSFSCSNMLHSGSTDPSDSIETRRRSNVSSSLSSSTVIYSLGISILRDEACLDTSGSAESSDYEYFANDKLSGSDCTDANSELGSGDGDQIDNVGSSELLQVEKALASFQFDEDIINVSMKHTDFKESCPDDMHLSKCNDPVLLRKTNTSDKQPLRLSDNSNNKELDGDELNLEETGDKNLVESFQSSSSNSKKVNEKKLTGAQEESPFQEQNKAKSNEPNLIIHIPDSDGPDLFKKPLSISDKKASTTLKSTLNFKLRNVDESQNLRNKSLYPSTSTPFDSPVGAVQDIPSVFKNVSPVNKPMGYDTGQNCAIDHISFMGIQATKKYGKRRKFLREKETQRWEAFLKTHSNSSYNRNNSDSYCMTSNSNYSYKNNYVHDSSILNKSNYYLFESPPAFSDKNVPVDDIWKLRKDSLRDTESAKHSKVNSKSGRKTGMRKGLKQKLQDKSRLSDKGTKRSKRKK